MSKRRKAGDIVFKEENAGFMKGQLTIRLLENEYDDPCLLDCGDDSCIEWANAEVIENGKAIDYVYHISECQMKDYSIR